VAAVAAEGEKEPAVFETESHLVVSATRLIAAFTRDPANDLYTNHIKMFPNSTEDRTPEAVFQGITKIEHFLYIAHDDIFNHPEITSLTLSRQGNLNVALESWDEKTGKWVNERAEG